ncbi:hypothetical protein BV898_03747 [Hypsibius exemplaris]|uniref:CCHC-type domain-containing protein n=1 Tax=Hypsibius exemplaris TaxID=2072580 RepID=A0A1W0X4H9_HYPEX|nr:hypothetical protein BV898_03747 [Hypsibius exemplaris]
MTKVECEPSPSLRPSVFDTSDKIRQWLDTGLENFERLEVVYALLSTLTHLEVRYFHAVLHSFMIRDFHNIVEAQDLVRRTNDVFALRDLYATLDPLLLLTSEMARNQVLLDLSVLHPASTSCGDIICDFIELSGITAYSPSLQSPDAAAAIADLMMIVAMAFRHPAVRFHRRFRLGQIAVDLIRHKNAFTHLQRLPTPPPTSVVMVEAVPPVVSETMDDDRTPEGAPDEFVLESKKKLCDEEACGGDFSDSSVSNTADLVPSVAAYEMTIKLFKTDHHHYRHRQGSRKSLFDTHMTTSAQVPPISVEFVDPCSRTREENSTTANSDVSSQQLPGAYYAARDTAQGLPRPLRPEPERTHRRLPLIKANSCYNCGSNKHSGQDCRVKSFWEWNPYSEVSNYCAHSEDPDRRPTEVMSLTPTSEVYYAQRHGKQWNG